MKKILFFLISIGLAATSHAQWVIEVRNKTGDSIWVAITQGTLVGDVMTTTRHMPLRIPEYKPKSSLPFPFNPNANTNQFILDIWKTLPEEPVVLESAQYWINNDVWLTKPNARYVFDIDFAKPKTFHVMWTGDALEAQPGENNVTQEEVDAARKW